MHAALLWEVVPAAFLAFSVFASVWQITGTCLAVTWVYVMLHTHLVLLKSSIKFRLILRRICPQWLLLLLSAKILDDLSCLSPLWVVEKIELKN